MLFIQTDDLNRYFYLINVSKCFLQFLMLRPWVAIVLIEWCVNHSFKRDTFLILYLYLPKFYFIRSLLNFLYSALDHKTKNCTEGLVCGRICIFFFFLNMYIVCISVYISNLRLHYIRSMFSFFEILGESCLSKPA